MTDPHVLAHGRFGSSLVDTIGLEIIGPPAVTSLSQGIGQSVEVCRGLQTSGRLVPEDHGLEISSETLIDRAG